MFDNLWVEKYRPKSLDEIVLAPEVAAVMQEYKTKGEIPNLLLAGRAGGGKSSLAKILTQGVLDCQYLYINASDRNGIDTVRIDISNFAKTRSIDGKLKVVILDECLDENTLIWILRDSIQQKIAIKNLDTNTDLVKTYDFNTSRYYWSEFSKIDQGIQEVYELELENGEIVVCTASHKWYVMENGIRVKKTLQEIINNNITDIISPQIDSIIPDTH